MRKPTNTKDKYSKDPGIFIAEATIFGQSGAIENMEAEGQKDFTQSDTLPVEMDVASKVALEKAGVKFMGPVEGDDLFQYVQLPEGWKKEPTDHSMWSRLLDNKGRVRASIFYKAAFYDRSAHLGVNCRYKAEFDREINALFVEDADMKKRLFTPKSTDYSKSREECTEWLNKNFPDWQKCEAYWD